MPITITTRIPSVTLTDDQRAQAFYEWGLNCKILGYEEPKAEKILDDWSGGSMRKVYEIFEVDAFWNGFHNGYREHGEIVPIHISL